MKVKLVNNWFAPKSEYVRDSMRIFSGKFFPKGEHVMPDELREFLPSSAKILDDTKEKKAEKEVPVPPATSLKDFDMERAAAVSEMEIQNEQHEKIDPMAKARAARAKKRAEKQAR